MGGEVGSISSAMIRSQSFNETESFVCELHKCLLDDDDDYDYYYYLFTP